MALETGGNPIRANRLVRRVENCEKTTAFVNRDESIHIDASVVEDNIWGLRMHRRTYILNSLFVSVATASILSGCFGISSVRYSKPTLLGASAAIRSVNDVGEMYVFDKIDAFVFALNARSTNIGLFPIPFYEAEHDPKVPKFRLLLALEAKHEGIVFDVTNVEY